MKTKLTPSIYKFILSLDAEDEKNSDYVVKHIGSRPKEGSDTGHLVSLAESGAESKIIVKAGITLSLVRQVTEHYLAKDDTKIEKKLGKFIPNDYFRLLNQTSTPEVGREINEAFLTLVEDNQVFTSVLAGVKKGKIINVYDIYHITFEMVKYNSLLNEYIGLPALFDLINGVFSQNIINLYHESYLNKENIPTAMVLAESNKAIVYIGSKMICDGNVTGLDELIKEIFINGNSDIKEAAQIFSTIISENGLDGIFAAILHRQIWGESADIGPDNMLVVKEQGRLKVVNIDITGFRYERVNDSKLPNGIVILGWLKTISELNADVIADRLLDVSVFKPRYLNGIKEQEIIHHTVITALKSILLSEVKKEINTVKDFYSRLDLHEIQNALVKFSNEVYELFPFKPSTNIFNQVLERNNNFLSGILEHFSSDGDDVGVLGHDLEPVLAENNE